jgi:uncharacterized protein
VASPQWGNRGGWSTQPPAYAPPRQAYPGPSFGQSAAGSWFGSAQSSLPQYGPPPAVPRPPQRNPLKTVLLGLITLCVLAIAGLVLVNLVVSSPSVAYQNDEFTVPPPDTNPPPLPQPQTEAEAEALLTRNPFYRQVAPIPVRCNSQPINVATATDTQLKAHFTGLTECLMRVWQPPVTRAGFEIVRPSVTIYGSQITTRCGTSEVNAFYCSADQQIYFSNLLPEHVRVVADDKWAADVVMAHEFGHALQGRTGILISSAALGQISGDQSTELQFSRRSETQADCLSGMFMRAVSQSMGIQQSDVAGILDTFRAVGDDALTGAPNREGNHGTAASRVYWGGQGLGTSAVDTCNTFVAPVSRVR